MGKGQFDEKQLNSAFIMKWVIGRTIVEALPQRLQYEIAIAPVVDLSVDL